MARTWRSSRPGRGGEGEDKVTSPCFIYPASMWNSSEGSRPGGRRAGLGNWGKALGTLMAEDLQEGKPKSREGRRTEKAPRRSTGGASSLRILREVPQRAQSFCLLGSTTDSGGIGHQGTHHRWQIKQPPRPRKEAQMPPSLQRALPWPSMERKAGFEGEEEDGWTAAPEAQADHRALEQGAHDPPSSFRSLRRRRPAMLGKGDGERRG